MAGRFANELAARRWVHIADTYRLRSVLEVSGYLVGSTAFKAAETGDPRLAGSIPVHLRQTNSGLCAAISPQGSKRTNPQGRQWLHYQVAHRAGLCPQMSLDII